MSRRDDDDELAAARGLVNAVTLSLVIYLVLAITAWFILG
jgi:hypothetical protein